ncbi:hypothetical protein PR048_014602 [Dryococelus australis]|uniref:Uncharacterized protein n=1 Tax=Dryococelus australis TaxID=614101 RepID=A0ABQ9HFG7_9NEOP|nr:hypothetical protein PR048_014602 [Dryococelus australis]
MCKPSSMSDGYHCFPGLHVRLTCRPSNMSRIWLVGDFFVADLQQPLLVFCGLAYKPRGEPTRVIGVSMEQCRREWVGETGDPGENPPTSGIVWHDPPMRKSGSDSAGIEPDPPFVGGEQANRLATATPLPFKFRLFVVWLFAHDCLSRFMQLVMQPTCFQKNAVMYTAELYIATLLACHQGNPGSIPGQVTPDSRMWETMPLVGGFSRGYPVSPACSFRRCSILASITLTGSHDLNVKSCPNLFFTATLLELHFVLQVYGTNGRYSVRLSVSRISGSCLDARLRNVGSLSGGNPRVAGVTDMYCPGVVVFSGYSHCASFYSLRHVSDPTTSRALNPLEAMSGAASPRADSDIIAILASCSGADGTVGSAVMSSAAHPNSPLSLCHASRLLLLRVASFLCRVLILSAHFIANNIVGHSQPVVMNHPSSICLGAFSGNHGKHMSGCWTRNRTHIVPNASRTVYLCTTPRSPMRVIEISMEQRRNKRAGNRKIPEKTRRPATSSGTIPTCKIPGATPPEIKPGPPAEKKGGGGRSSYDKYRRPHPSLLDTRSRRFPFCWPLLSLLVFNRLELCHLFTRLGGLSHFIAFALTIWKVQRTPSHAERTKSAIQSILQINV